MDPMLKDYLDKLHQDSKADTAIVMYRLEAQASQLRNQTQQIDDLLRWKPDLEARFAKLETMVATLQATTQARLRPRRVERAAT